MVIKKKTEAVKYYLQENKKSKNFVIKNYFSYLNKTIFIIF